MGSPLIKRLDALYQRAQMVMKVQADHAPFVSIAPWSFMKDECREILSRGKLSETRADNNYTS